MLRSATLCLLFCLLTTWVVGQKNAFTSSDPYSYVFKLDSARLEVIKARGVFDTTWFFTNKVDSFKGALPDLKPGNYLVATFRYSYLQYSLFRIAFADMQAHAFNGVIQVRFYDTLYKSIPDVKFFLDKKEVNWSSDCGCFEVKNFEKTKPYYATYKGSFMMGTLAASTQRVSVASDNFNSYNPNLVNGYLVLNQPKFHPRDTVKLKGYFLHAEGTPFLKPLKLILIRNSDGKEINLATLKPVSRGAYVHTFVLPDTLKSDQSYSLQFREKSNRVIKQTNFTIEEYKLKTNTYNSWMDKSKFYKGEPVKIFVTATDANDLPIQDGKVRVRLRLSEYSNFTGKYLFVPNEWYSNLHEIYTEVNQSGQTEIEIPASVFPPLDVTLEAEVSISGSSGELRQFVHRINRIQDSTYYKLNYSEGRINAMFIKNGREDTSRAVVMIQSVFGKVSIDTVSIPYQRKVEPYMQNVLIRNLDGVYEESLLLPDFNQTILLSGNRTVDSVYFKLNNPAGIEIHYRIYKNDKLILAGFGNSLEFKRVDTSSESYNVLYFWYNRGVPYFKELILPFRDKNLVIKTNLPERIYPGQTVPLDIYVYNADRKPQPDVNLTAFGVNAMFENYDGIDLPYFGTLKGHILRMDNVTNFPWPYSGYNSQLNKVSYTTLLSAGFSTQSDYRLKYPNEELLIRKIPLNYKQPEVLPFVVANGKRIEIYYMELDGKPFFLKTSVAQSSMSRLIPAGLHRLGIRTRTAFYTLPAIEFNDSFRYVISFDTLCLPAGILKDTSLNSQRFSTAETEKMKSSLFLLSPGDLPGGIHSLVLSTPETVIPLSAYLFTYYHQQKGSYAFAYSFINPSDSIEVLHYGKSVQKIKFIPGNLYSWYDNRLITEEQDSVSFVFGSAFFTHENEYFNNIFDSAFRVFKPVNFTVGVPDEKHQSSENKMADVEEQCVYKYNYYPLEGGSEERVLLKLFYPENVNWKSLFLMNNRFAQKSVLNPENAFNGSSGLELFLDTGNYTIYGTGLKNQAVITSDIQIRKDGVVLFRLDSSDFVRKCTELKPIVSTLRMLEELRKLRETMVVSYRVEDYTEFREKAPVELSKGNEKAPVLSGYVVNKEGNAIENVIVTLEQNGKPRGIGFTDGAGGFLIREIPSGVYQMRFTRYGNCVTIYNQIQLRNGQIHEITARLNDCGFSGSNDPIPVVNFGRSEISAAMREGTKYDKDPLLDGFGMIKGRVVEALSKSPVELATITLLKKGKAIKSLISDENGEFSFKNIEPGRYDLTVVYLGYSKSMLQDIDVIENDIRIVNLALKEQRNEMNEVVVVTSKHLVDKGVDRYVEEAQIAMAPPLYSRSVESIQGSVMGVESRSYSNISVRGSRSDETAYYVDGVRATGASSNVIPSSLEIGPDEFKRMREISQNRDVKSDREIFRDYAFWVPNLVTDQNGQAHVGISFPDNLTSWKNFILAMDENLNTQVYSNVIKSYKPVSASLHVPSFAIKGDRIFLKGKVVNYSNEKIKVFTSFTLSGVEKTSVERESVLFPEESLDWNVISLDTVKAGYRMKTDFGYEDGEKYKVPVYEDGVFLNEVKVYSLNKDTVLNFSTDSDGKYTLNLSNSYSQMLRDEIERLRLYRYGCVEQTASKLVALLAEQKICRLLGDSFTQIHMIKHCIGKLEAMQQSNGSFGWFTRSGAEFWLTHYVVLTLQEAAKAGYSNKGAIRGVDYFKANLNLFSPDEKIKAAQVLMNARANVNFAALFEPLDENALSNYSRTLLTLVKQRLGMPHFSGFLYSGIQRNNEGEVYWTQPFENIYQNSTSLSLMAYEVLKYDGADSAILAGIRKHFFNGYVYQNQYRNTLETALIIQTMAADVVKADKGNFVTVIRINNNQIVKQMPFKLNLVSGSSYQIEKTGYPASLSIVKNGFVANPKADSTAFKIKSEFWQDRKSGDFIRTGIPAELLVHVNAVSNSEFIMIQIPIPASCTFADKTNTFQADEVEFLKDRVILYFRKMSKGNYTYRILLEPRFEGEFHLLPVQAGNMYDPMVRGNNMERIITVKGLK